MRVFLGILLFSISVGSSYAQTWDENLERGAATTEQNHLNVPFVKPDNWKTPYTTPGNWPVFENRGPIDRSPSSRARPLDIRRLAGAENCFDRIGDGVHSRLNLIANRRRCPGVTPGNPAKP